MKKSMNVQYLISVYSNQYKNNVAKVSNKIELATTNERKPNSSTNNIVCTLN